MALRPLPSDQVAPTAQALLAFLERDDVTVPGSMLESIVSGKSLLRALLQEQLILCHKAEESPPVPQPAEEPEEEAA